MKVELGAGATAREGWFTVDVNPAFGPAVVASALDLPFRCGTVKELRAVDVLEHLSYRDTESALNEWARVCAPGAALFAQVPDADEIMRWYNDSPARLTVPKELPQTPLAGAAWRLLGGHADSQYATDSGDWRWNAHYAFFSRDSLRASLDRAGFDVLQMKRNGHPNLLALAKRR